MLEKIIKATNLNEKEARLYLAALELGKNSITILAKRARLNRITAYSIAEKLIQKGYLESSTQNSITIFDAINPQSIAEQISEKSRTFKKLLPDLRRLHKKNDHPTIRYFEGVEAIKSLYQDSLSSSTEILNFANSSDIRQFWPEYDQDYVHQRAKKKIFLRGFAPDDDYGQKVASENTKYYREIRLLPADSAHFHNEINIYDDKISMVSFSAENPLGIIIQNQEIADTQRAIFELLWNK